MTTFFLITQIVLAVIITIAVLLQKSSSIGLGAYSGSNESVFGAKGPAGFLAKSTMVLGLLFVLNTIALSYAYNKQSQKSVLDSMQTTSQNSTSPAPSVNTDESANAFIVDENIPSAPLLNDAASNEANKADNK
ncbi:preprotein translocase subunit SecG [Helicobacter jaachi]|uniref:Protein-export membrane protein SecG n=1 Tax=Helicobacter jaachi TaxID=1677920 RepID=A0A4U8T8Z7_9HELI|nr:preprotein translocase subunit SecG [Helicobacter jaachi]TLD96044.1 preprotein translocase subunit SecG [Helicobacter jaachi]